MTADSTSEAVTLMNEALEILDSCRAFIPAAHLAQALLALGVEPRSSVPATNENPPAAQAAR